MTPEQIAILACGRGHDGWWDENPPLPPDPPKKPDGPPRVLVFIVGFLIGVSVMGLWRELVPSVRASESTGTTVEIGPGETGTFTLAVPLASYRTGPILTGDDRIDREWALVEELYPEEALYVTDIVLANETAADGATAWVENCAVRPTVIHVSRRYARALPTAEAVGSMLAHEMTHVTQCRAAERADYQGRQREANLRELEYAQKRRAYYAAFNLGGES
jgi:hypothetical protein